MLDQLQQLRIELVDRAYLLERHGRADAADLANELAGRLGKLIAGGTGRSTGVEIVSECCPERPDSFVG